MTIQESGEGDTVNRVNRMYSQINYQESPFSEANWEVVGNDGKEAIFMPQRFEVLKSEFVKLDPMFADYGGASDDTDNEQFREHQAGGQPNSGIGGVKGSTDRGAELRSREQERLGSAIATVTMNEEELQSLLEKTREEERSRVTNELELSFKEQMAAGEKRLQDTLSDLSKQLSEEISRVEQSSVDLVLSIADKIVGASIEVNPEYILPIIKEAIALTGAATIKRILVGKDDLEFLSVLGFDRQFKGNGAGWNFELDDSIRMGCVVETSAGEVDYQLDQAWERVKDGLLKARTETA